MSLFKQSAAILAITASATLWVVACGNDEPVVTDPVTVECKTSEDCAAGNRCNSLGKCIDDSIPSDKECNSNSDCPSGKKCNSLGKCIDDSTPPDTKECNWDSDCGEGKKCNSLGKCITDDTQPSCMLDSECKAGEKCNVLTGKCETPSCAGHQDCGKEDVCVNSVCVKEVGNDCSGNEQCKAGTCIFLSGMDYGYCSKTCTSFSQCPSFWDCEKLSNTTAKL
jgi:Cys-rich repeat protein